MLVDDIQEINHATNTPKYYIMHHLLVLHARYAGKQALEWLRRLEFM
jgi:hypothetical protein